MSFDEWLAGCCGLGCVKWVKCLCQWLNTQIMLIIVLWWLQNRHHHHHHALSMIYRADKDAGAYNWNTLRSQPIPFPSDSPPTAETGFPLATEILSTFHRTRKKKSSVVNAKYRRNPYTSPYWQYSFAPLLSQWWIRFPRRQRSVWMHGCIDGPKDKEM